MLVYNPPLNTFDMKALMKGADALYDIDLLSFFNELTIKAQIWAERLQ